MDGVELRMVRYFVAVAEELHFGRAAERLHIAQPSLSQQIRRLEQHLGVTLLERTSRKVQLTEGGRVFLSEGRRLLKQSDRMLERTRSAGVERLMIGFYGSAGSVWLPRIVRAFTDEHPYVEIAVRELFLGRIDDILTGSVDAAFTRLLPGQGDVETEVLAREPRLVALPADHPLAAAESLAFADLRNESFIVNPAVQGPSPPARWLREQARHGLPGRVAAQAASIQEILALVVTDRGVSLVPESVVRYYPHAGVAYVPVRDADPAVISLSRRRGTARPAVQALIELARELTARETALPAADQA